MIICLNRLVKHPLAYTIKDYINSFRTKLSDTIAKQQIEPVRTDFEPQCCFTNFVAISRFSYATIVMVDPIK